MRLLFALRQGTDVAVGYGPGVLYPISFISAEWFYAAGIDVSQSSVPDVGVSCGGVHNPRYIVVGDSRGFAEKLILRVALEHDVERAHPLVSRVLFERNDDASSFRC